MMNTHQWWTKGLWNTAWPTAGYDLWLDGAQQAMDTAATWSNQMISRSMELAEGVVRFTMLNPAVDLDGGSYFNAAESCNRFAMAMMGAVPKADYETVSLHREELEQESKKAANQHKKEIDQQKTRLSEFKTQLAEFKAQLEEQQIQIKEQQARLEEQQAQISGQKREIAALSEEKPKAKAKPKARPKAKTTAKTNTKKS
jgi:hypothetical protein